jgi:exopolysaccharide production protein ExoZ
LEQPAPIVTHSDGEQKILSIQALRFVAAAWVVFHHALGAAHEYTQRLGLPDTAINRFYNLPTLGNAGVDLFFVISGFVMVFATWRTFGQHGAARDFLARRLIRIFPPYWICTTIVAAALLAYPGQITNLSWDGGMVFASYLLLPVYSVDDLPRFLLFPGWTLAYEMYFYLVFFALMWLPRKTFLAAISALFLASVAVRLALAHRSQPLEVITNPLLLEFLFGVWVGHTYFYLRDAGPGLTRLLAGAGITAFGLTLFVSLGVSRVIEWGLPAALLVLGFALAERAGRLHVPWLLAELGNSSYSLYLTHTLTYPLLSKLWLKLGWFHAAPAVVFVVVASVACIGAGHGFYLVVERPIMRRLTAMWKAYYRPGLA